MIPNLLIVYVKRCPEFFLQTIFLLYLKIKNLPFNATKSS